MFCRVSRKLTELRYVRGRFDISGFTQTGSCIQSRIGQTKEIYELWTESAHSCCIRCLLSLACLNKWCSRPPFFNEYVHKFIMNVIRFVQHKPTFFEIAVHMNSSTHSRRLAQAELTAHNSLSLASINTAGDKIEVPFPVLPNHSDRTPNTTARVNAPAGLRYLWANKRV